MLTLLGKHVRDTSGRAEAEPGIVDNEDIGRTMLGGFVARTPLRADKGGMVGGFTISGDLPIRVLVRGVNAVRPPSAAVDPRIDVYRGNTLLHSNNDWDGSDYMANAFRMADTTPLVPNGRDAALVATLMPGSYTVHLTSADNTSGLVVLEVKALQ